MNNNHLTQDESLKSIQYNPLENGKEKLMDLPEEINEIEYENFKNYFDSIISFSAQTGELNIDWLKLRKILEIKIMITFREMNSKYADIANKSFDYNQQLNNIIQNLKKFKTKPPFTLQRMCEILLNPENYYRSIRKLFFAFNKLVDLDE